MSALPQSLIRALRLKDPTPDAVLVRATAVGDPEAFPALVARHRPMVLRACRQVPTCSCIARLDTDPKVGIGAAF
jgi:hypothetical protein